MGLIGRVLDLVFGGGRNVLRETAEVFTENAEAASQRAHAARRVAIEQMGAEFRPQSGAGFDRFMDGLNRVPRPALALGTLGLFVAAMTDPLWFAARMQGIALVPEPLWWLLGVIVTFYFGARHQQKHQGFQRDIAAVVARAPQVAENIRLLDGMAHAAPERAPAETGADADRNPALEEWKQLRGAAR